MTCSFFQGIGIILRHLFADPQLLASVFNMTKRDSVFAGIDSPRAPTSMQRRQSHLDGQSSSGATSSGDRLQPSSTMDTLSQNPHHGMDHSGSYSHAHHYRYTSVSPSVPLPDGSTHCLHEEAYPLQAEIEQQHRILHTHIFTEVISPHQTGVNRLMVTEVDRFGVKRNRQWEFFFNGIVGHIRADRHGWINSWEQSTQLANCWRRHFNIPEVNNENNSWQHHQQPSDNADRPEESQESTPKSKMEDDDSTAANVGTASAPIVRSTSWPQSSGTFSTMTENPMLRSLRSLSIREMT